MQSVRSAAVFAPALTAVNSMRVSFLLPSNATKEVSSVQPNSSEPLEKVYVATVGETVMCVIRTTRIYRV